MSGLADVHDAGALLANIFHEVYLCNVDTLPKGTERLRDYITNVMSAHEHPSMTGAVPVAMLLASDTSSVDCQPGCALDFIKITHDSSASDILQIRVIAHLACAAFNAGDTDIARIYRTLITDPGMAAKSYLPGMPEDGMAMVMKALQGRWWKCPNGHPYYVDACGRPTEVKPCPIPGCPHKIGGNNHVQLAGQSDVDEKLQGSTSYFQKSRAVDNSPMGYALSPINSQETLREMSPQRSTVVQLLTHAALVMGAATGGEQWETDAEGQLVDNEKRAMFLNSCDKGQNRSMGAFFLQQFKRNWRDFVQTLGRSEDEAATLLHQIIALMANDVDPLPDGGQAYRDEADTAYQNRRHADLGRAEVDENFASELSNDTGDPKVFTLLSTRQTWENEACKRYLAKTLDPDGMTGRLQQLSESFVGADEATIFMGELKETGDANALSAEERAHSMPLLWSFRRPFTIQRFKDALQLADPKTDDRYKRPILARLFQSDQGGEGVSPVLEHQLRNLQYLPGVLTMCRELNQRYSRRISRQEARVITFGDFLNEADTTGNGDAMREAFAQYAAAFNGSIEFLDRFGCTEIPPAYKAIRVSEATNIAISLFDDQDEMLLCGALIQWLKFKHEEVLLSVDEMMLLNGNESQRYAGGTLRARWDFFTQDQAFAYDLPLIEDYIKKQCVTYSSDGDLVYDFKKAEDWIVDRFFTGKPLLDLDIGKFMFPEDTVSADRESLKGVIAQEPLPGQMVQDIRAELSTSTLASRTRSAVATVISFITASSQELSASAGNTLVETYVRETLLIPGDHLQSKEVAKQVCIKHLDAVWMLLDQLASPDPFAGVDPFYKQDLSEANVASLMEAAKKMDVKGVIAPFLMEFIKDHIRGRPDFVSTALKDWCYELEDDGFDDHFPDDINMPQVVACYKLLDNISQ
jgi:hypothetical protein